MRKLFNKITGHTDDEYDAFEDLGGEDIESLWDDESPIKEDEPLAVDVYQDENNLYIKAFIPGINPENLDIDIARDSITLKGQSYREASISDENYYEQELSWGVFARTISLPKEIDIEGAKAKSKHGVLHITLPKIDKDRRTKLTVS
ncbi:MAG: Hsp20/alpha crystallin family protein [Patescibacteria group bacterium]